MIEVAEATGAYVIYGLYTYTSGMAYSLPEHIFIAAARRLLSFSMSLDNFVLFSLHFFVNDSPIF